MSKECLFQGKLVNECVDKGKTKGHQSIDKVQKEKRKEDEDICIIQIRMQ